MYQCFPANGQSCSEPGYTLCSRTGTVHTPVGPCYDEMGPIRCGKKVQKGRCYKKQNPTKARAKMVRKCSFSCNFCDQRTPSTSTVVG